MKLMKRVFAFAMMLCLLMVCVAPTEAMAATNYKGMKQTFQIRLSKGYGRTGVTVTMRSSSADGKTGTITFNDDLEVKVGKVYGSYLKIRKGTVYNYKISKLKEDAKIVLTFKTDAQGLPYPGNSLIGTLNGEIHIDKSKGCNIANIWKIDTLCFDSSKYNFLKKMNVYFRND